VSVCDGRTPVLPAEVNAAGRSVGCGGPDDRAEFDTVPVLSSDPARRTPEPLSRSPRVGPRFGPQDLHTHRNSANPLQGHRPPGVGPEQLTQFAFRPAGGPTEAGTAAQTWRCQGSTPRRGLAFVGAT